MFDDIRDKLESWEAPAPEGLWKRIEAAQESAGAQEKRSSGKIRPVIRWITVAAGTAAAAATLLIMLFSPAQDSTDIPLTAQPSAHPARKPSQARKKQAPQMRLLP